MKSLVKKRDALIKQLLELAPEMLMGSITETYRTCGTPTCRCHTTGPKHGPHRYVSYKGQSGKTTGYYVPKKLHEKVATGLSAWRKFHVLAKEITHLNKKMMDVQNPRKKRVKRSTQESK
jgi:hypothetical protein